MTPLDKALKDAIRAGEDPNACGCMGCQNKTADRECPCGARCRCRCTLPAQVEGRAAFAADIARLTREVAAEAR